MGSKKAKKMKLMEKLGEDSAAASAQTEALQSVANSATGLVLSFNRKRKVDSLHKQVDSHIKLGMTDKALAILEKVQELEAEMDEQDAKKLPAQVPASIDVAPIAEGGNDDGEEEDDDDDDASVQVRQTGAHFRS